MSAEFDHPDDLIAWNRLATVVRVLSGTAHDVNNALQIIAGSAELLENQAGLSESGRRAVIRIRAQSARAAGLVDELTRFARGAGPMQRVALKEIVIKAMSLRALMIRRTGLAIEMEADAFPLALVVGRSEQLLQAVLNMIMDAEQGLHQQKGGTMKIVLTEEDGQAVLQTIDNALASADRLRGFEIRTSSRPPAESSALGLDAARWIARAHGGDLALDLLPDGGRVTLRLPLARSG